MPASPPPLDAAARARYGRQIRLPEIGEAGQARLCASEVVIGGAGDARNVEASYVARAGMRVIDVATSEKSATDGEHDATLAALGLVDPAARDVGDGALRALLAIKRALAKEDGK